MKAEPHPWKVQAVGLLLVQTGAPVLTHVWGPDPVVLLVFPPTHLSLTPILTAHNQQQNGGKSPDRVMTGKFFVRAS